MNQLATFAITLQRVERKVLVCDDKSCRHRSPVLHLFAVTYRGHRVSVTRDGDRFDVQIDRDLGKTRRGMTWDEAVRFVEEMTR